MRTLLLLVLFVLPLAAERAPERVPWCRSPELLAGRLVDVRLLSGERVSGAWASIKDNTFTLVDGKGRSQTFARGQIRSVQAHRRRVARRVLGAIAGFYAGAAVASGGQAEALQSGAAFAALGGGVVGFFAGRSLDRDSRAITLLFSPGCD
jgi:hypothetical protein